MESTLHNILGAVESLNLPEGEYLEATNLLKKAFELKQNNENIIRHLRVNHPISFNLDNTFQIDVVEGDLIIYEGNKQDYIHFKVRIYNNQSVKEIIYDEGPIEIFINNIIELLCPEDIEVTCLNITFPLSLEKRKLQEQEPNKPDSYYIHKFIHQSCNVIMKEIIH